MNLIKFCFSIVIILSAFYIVAATHNKSKITAFVSCVRKINKNVSSGKCIVWWGYHSRHTKSVKVTHSFSHPRNIDGDRPGKFFAPGHHKFVFKTIIDCKTLKKSASKIHWTINKKKYCMRDFFKNHGKINESNDHCHKKSSCKQLKCKRKKCSVTDIIAGCKHKVTCHLVNTFNFFVKHHGQRHSHHNSTYNLFPVTLDHSTSIESFYGYDTVNPKSIGSGIEKQFKNKLKNRLWVVPIIKKNTNKLYYIINADVPHDGSGGEVELSIKYPATQYGSPIYENVKDDQDDDITWDNNLKIITAKMNWVESKSDGFVIKAPINGCIKLTVRSAVGIYTDTFNIVGVNAKGRIVKNTPFGKNLLCSGCCLSKHPSYNGIKPCIKYDKCGVCEGDGKTCPNNNVCQGGHCKAKVYHKTTCDVHYNIVSDSFEFIVSGLFKNGEEVTANMINSNPNDSEKCKLQWNHTDSVYKGDIFRRQLRSTIKFSKIAKCLNDGHGKIKIKSRVKNGAKNGMIYEAPCNFHIKNTGFGIISSRFTVKRLTCKVKIKRIEWISPKNPEHPLIMFRTIMPNYYGKTTLLINPKIIRFVDHGKCGSKMQQTMEWKFVQNKSPTCFNSGGDYNKYCKQSWIIRPKKPLKCKCIKGKLTLRFEKKTSSKIKKYVNVDLYMNELCKPIRVSVKRARGCKLYASGPFLNEHYTRKPKFVGAGDRVYYKVKSKKNMEIVYARVCYLPSEYTSLDPKRICSDERSVKHVIYDKRIKFKNNMWKTIITPISNQMHSNHTHALYGLSFKSLLFEAPNGFINSYILQIIGSCHTKICGMSTKYLMDDGSRDPHFRNAVESTWYDFPTDCQSGDSCTSIIIPMSCPSGYYFESGSIKGGKRRHSGTCIKHAIYDNDDIIIAVLATIAIIFVILVTIALCSASSGEIMEKIKKHEDKEGGSKIINQNYNIQNTTTEKRYNSGLNHNIFKNLNEFDSPKTYLLTTNQEI